MDFNGPEFIEDIDPDTAGKEKTASIFSSSVEAGV